MENTDEASVRRYLRESELTWAKRGWVWTSYMTLGGEPMATGLPHGASSEAWIETQWTPEAPRVRAKSVALAELPSEPPPAAAERTLTPEEQELQAQAAAFIEKNGRMLYPSTISWKSGAEMNHAIRNQLARTQGPKESAAPAPTLSFQQALEKEESISAYLAAKDEENRPHRKGKKAWRAQPSAKPTRFSAPTKRRTFKKDKKGIIRRRVVVSEGIRVPNAEEAKLWEDRAESAAARNASRALEIIANRSNA